MRCRGGGLRAAKPLNITVHVPSKSDKIPSRCSLTEISDMVCECRSSEAARKESSPQTKLQEGGKKTKLVRVCAAGRWRAAGVSCAPVRAGNRLLCWSGPPPLPATQTRGGRGVRVGGGEGGESEGERGSGWAGPQNTWENGLQSHFSSLLSFIGPPSTSFSRSVTLLFWDVCLFCATILERWH